MRKVSFIERIEEQKLILPILVAAALAANARLIYYFMLLQAGPYIRARCASSAQRCHELRLYSNRRPSSPATILAITEIPRQAFICGALGSAVAGALSGCAGQPRQTRRRRLRRNMTRTG